jgi:hypothetical protein
VVRRLCGKLTPAPGGVLLEVRQRCESSKRWSSGSRGKRFCSEGRFGGRRSGEFDLRMQPRKTELIDSRPRIATNRGGLGRFVCVDVSGLGQLARHVLHLVSSGGKRTGLRERYRERDEQAGNDQKCVRTMGEEVIFHIRLDVELSSTSESSRSVELLFTILSRKHPVPSERTRSRLLLKLTLLLMGHSPREFTNRPQSCCAPHSGQCTVYTSTNPTPVPPPFPATMAV